jgi:excisionase family DNA binding protein
MDELLDIAQVATYLGVSERTVYDRVRAGTLPAIRVGRLWRVRVADLEAWLDSNRPCARLPAAAADHGARPAPSRADLEGSLAGIDDQLDRRLTFVGMLSRAVGALEWPPPVIVGGNAVQFYTGGDYATVDIDLVGASEPLAEVLDGWGFERKGRHWLDETLGIVVEAPGSQLSSDEQAHVASVNVGTDVVLVLGIEDLIVDRLNATAHWGDEESRLWAESLIGAALELDVDYLRKRAADEGVSELLETVLVATGGRDANL